MNRNDVTKGKKMLARFPNLAKGIKRKERKYEDSG